MIAGSQDGGSAIVRPLDEMTLRFPPGHVLNLPGDRQRRKLDSRRTLVPAIHASNDRASGQHRER